MIVQRAWMGEDASVTETESHFVFSWPNGYQVIDLTDRDRFYGILSSVVHDLMVSSYQQGYTKGSGDGYATGFADAVAQAAKAT